MDESRFDDVARAWSAGASRRAVLATVLTGAVAALTRSETPNGASAKKRKKRKKRSCAPACIGKNCGDADGCGGLCTTQQGCGAGQSCVGGQCINGGCATDFADCDGDGDCETNTTTSTQHCGSCNNPCGNGQTCENKVCTGGGTSCPSTCAGDKVCNESTGGFCQCPADKPVQCEFNSTRCSANPTTDVTRCGLNCYDCEVSFAPGYRCCAGQCVNGCGPSTSGSCQQDPCGSNCQPCTGGAVCCNLGSGTSSQCVEPVAGGYCPTP